MHIPGSRHPKYSTAVSAPSRSRLSATSLYIPSDPEVNMYLYCIIDRNFERSEVAQGIAIIAQISST